MKRHLLTQLMLIFILSLVFGAAGNASQSKIRIKIATLTPKGSMSSKILEELNEKVRAETNNEVSFKVYYGGIQGDAKDVLRKIKFKQLHGATLASYGLGQIASDVRITALPYVFKNYEEVDYVRSKLEGHMNNAMEKNGFTVLGWYDIGFVYSFSKVPITSLEVAQQQKFWAPEGDPLAQTVYHVLGISPVSLSITDVLTSLSTRLIDAASAPPLAAVAFRWYTKFQYMTEYPSTNVLGALVVSNDIWNKISPENRSVVKNLCRQYCKKIQLGNREQNQKSIEVLKKSGISIVRVSNNDSYQAFIKDTADKTMKALVGELFSQALLDETLGYLEEYRSAHPESRVAKIE